MTTLELSNFDLGHNQVPLVLEAFVDLDLNLPCDTDLPCSWLVELRLLEQLRSVWTHVY